MSTFFNMHDPNVQCLSDLLITFACASNLFKFVKKTVLINIQFLIAKLALLAWCFDQIINRLLLIFVHFQNL